MSTPKKPAAKRKATHIYKRPEPIPPGEILRDASKKTWSLGHSIGSGGFGDIYCATDVTEPESRKKKVVQYPYVVKIEPRENGPLFVEMNFYIRVCREDDVTTWRSLRKLTALSIPRLLGWGSHDIRSIPHRFLVMDRYGADIWTLFVQNNRQMPFVTTARIADQVLAALEYIHCKGYVHADVKGANLLLSTTDASRVFLVDFGMATLVSSKPDPKRAHNGTPEYVSRDAHTGAMTFRGDVETLILNVVQWQTGRLPWETQLTNLAALHAEKQKLLAAAGTALLKSCFPPNSTPAPGWLSSWFTQLSALDVTASPNYEALQRALRGSPGFTERGVLEFATPVLSPTKRPATAKAKRNGTKACNDNEESSPPKPKRGRPKRGARATNGQARKQSSESSDDSAIEETPPAATKRAAKRKTTPKLAVPSWRDGAAVSASNISRPGEYQRIPK